MKKLSDLVADNGDGTWNIGQLAEETQQVVIGDFLIKQARGEEVNLALELGKSILQCLQIAKMLVKNEDGIDPFFLKLFSLKVIFDKAFGIVMDIEKTADEKIIFKMR